MLQLTFLGTSAGVPTKQRNVTALAIECLNPYSSTQSQSRQKSRPWLLIDCGEGTQQQLLHTKLSLQQLKVICITHVHGDHCYGLPGLLASSAMSGRKDSLTLIAPKAIIKFLDAVTLATELYFPFAINFIAIEDILAKQVDKKDYENNSDKVILNLDAQQLEIDITALSHRVSSHAFGIIQTIHQRVLNTDKLKSQGIAPSALWGQLQQGRDVYTDKGQQLLAIDYTDNNQWRTRVVIAGDNDTPGLLATAVQDADLLVHEATYTSEVLTKIQTKNAGLDFDPMHSSAKQIAQFAQESGLDNLILTHFSARYQNFDNPDSSTANMSAIRLEAEAYYQGNLWLAEDFAQYVVEGNLVDSGESDKSNNTSINYLGLATDKAKT